MMEKKEKKNKVVFHVFDPTIYPRKLWVVKNASISDVSKLFYNYDKTEISIPDTYANNSKGLVFRVRDRNAGFYGVMVMLFGKCDIETVAHESVHVASCIFSDCGIFMGFDDGQDEHFAYLVGFVADCINQVRTNRFRE